VLERVAFEVLHYEIIEAVMLANIVQSTYVWMRELGNRTRLSPKTLLPIWFVRESGG